MTRPPSRREPRPVEWDFLSFPVLAGFSLGMFVATLLAPVGGIVVSVLSIVSLLGVSFSLAHVATHFFHNRALEKRLQRAEEEERERRALAARAAASRGSEPTARRRRRRGGGASSQ